MMNKIDIKRNVLLNPGPATTTDTVKMHRWFPTFVPEKRSLQV